MNARAEMPEPDFELIIGMLASPHMHSRSRFDEQGERLRSWLAAQPLAPAAGDGQDEGCRVNMTAALKAYTPEETAALDAAFARALDPPAPAREAVAWQYRIRLRDQWERWCNIPREEWEETHTSAHENIQYRRLFDETPSAGAVVVDEAATQRALCSYYNDRPDTVFMPHLHKMMQDAITAAIGGAG